MANTRTGNGVQIRNRHMKTVLFLSIVGIMFILLAAVMVQTTSQTNTTNSMAKEKKNAVEKEKERQEAVDARMDARDAVRKGNAGNRPR